LDRTRIVLIDMPRMLREIIREVVAAEPGAEVVAEFGEPVDLVPAVLAHRAGFVILGADLAAGEVARLLDELPRTRVLGVADDGGQSFLYELRPHMVELGEISPERLLEAIRG
jgi:DNA-binding NarL/FixJ family response regulator